MFESIPYNCNQPSFINILISRRSKQRILLSKSYKKYKRAKKLYEKRFIAWQALANPFKEIDLQINLLQHKEAKLLELQRKNAKAKKLLLEKRAKTSKKYVNTKEMVEQMLANLSEEQRLAVIANIKNA